MEANKFAYQMNAHSCTGSNGVFNSCTYQPECSVGVYANTGTNEYGPSITNTINSSEPFHVKTEFHENSAG